MSERYRIKVYIAGMTATARRTLANLDQLRAELPDDLSMDIEVIDVLQNPRIAEQERVLATPMVVKEAPEPVRRLIGDLSGREETLACLDLVI